MCVLIFLLLVMFRRFQNTYLSKRVTLKTRHSVCATLWCDFWRWNAL